MSDVAVVMGSEEGSSVAECAIDILRNNPLLLELVAGSLAGVCEYTSCQPIDIVCTRRMLDASATQRSIPKELVNLWGEGGLRRIYRGLGPQIMAAIPATCGMYTGERFFGRVFGRADGKPVASTLTLTTTPKPSPVGRGADCGGRLLQRNLRDSERVPFRSDQGVQPFILLSLDEPPPHTIT